MAGLDYRGPANSLTPSIGRRASASKPGDPLWTWRQWYTIRGLRRCRVSVIGDSISFGSGASGSTGAEAFQNEFCVKLGQFLNQIPMYGTNPVGESQIYSAGGGYHLRCATNTSAPDPWTTVGSPTLINRGTGGQARGFPTGASIAYTAKSSTGFYLVFEDGTGAIQPKFTITDAGGQVVATITPTINTGGAANLRTLIGTPELARGTYNVKIENNTGAGTAVVDGVYVIDGDATAGVCVMNHCFPGLSTAVLNAGDTRANTFTASLATLDSPDLLIINLGANDYGDNVNPATFQTNLSTLIDTWRTAVGTAKPILLIGWFQRWDILSPSFPWTSYAAAIRAVAATKSNLEYFDMTPYFPTSQVADDAGYNVVSSDSVHLSNRGHSYYAQIVADVLMRPFGGA